MAFKTNTRRIFTLSDNVGVGREVAVDLKRTPWAIHSFQIFHQARFSIANGTTATMKAFAPEMLLKYIRLQGSRPGGSDLIKHLTGTQLARLNTYDSASENPDRIGPTYAEQVYAPGTYLIATTLRLVMPPPRVNTEFANQCLLPGPAYSNLALYIFFEDFAQIWSANPANATFIDHFLAIDQVDVPTVDVAKSKFSQFQETYMRENISTANTGLEVRPPLGNFYRQMMLTTYFQANNVPNDFLIRDFELRENVSTIRQEDWNGLRRKNWYDYNLEGGLLSSPFTNGSCVLDFAEQGSEASLLDVTDFGYKGRDLKLVCNIPNAPATLCYLDVVSRIIIPRINV